MGFLGPGGKESKGANHKEGVRGRCRGMRDSWHRAPPLPSSFPPLLTPGFGCQTRKSAGDWESRVETGWGDWTRDRKDGGGWVETGP